MEQQTTTLDLREERSSRVQGAAFYALRSLARGSTVILLTAEEPSLMMRSLDLQLRNNLAWHISATAQGWRIEVRHRGDAAVVDVLDLLSRDHKRLDALLAQGMRLVDQADAAAAAPLLREFAGALARHVGAEDEVLMPLFGMPAAEDAPAAIMRREHDEILAQLAAIADCLAADAPEAGELSAYCAILSGTLAKHEYREENNLFPQWQVTLARKTTAEQKEIMSRVETLLQGDEG